MTESPSHDESRFQLKQDQGRYIEGLNEIKRLPEKEFISRLISFCLGGRANNADALEELANNAGLTEAQKNFILGRQQGGKESDRDAKNYSTLVLNGLYRFAQALASRGEGFLPIDTDSSINKEAS